MNPYYSLNDYFLNTYGEKCYKIAIDAGMGCPNRDGWAGLGGCSFCSVQGSGDFAVPKSVGDIGKQIEAGLALFQGYPIGKPAGAKCAGNPMQTSHASASPKSKKVGEKFVAYFQAFTNTYAPIETLRALYTEALSHPKIIGISIATRPDCLGEEVLQLLAELKGKFPDKFLWVELGLQTCHEHTRKHLGIGYDESVFLRSMADLKALDIPVILHVILGLPGEITEDILQTIDYVNGFQPFGVKLQLLHILKGSRMAEQYGITEPTKECLTYKAGSGVSSPQVMANDALADHTSEQLPDLHIYTMEEYLEVLISCIEHLDPSICLHRVTGDGPKDILLAPLWSGHKKLVLGTLHHLMATKNTYQGRLFHDSRSTHTL